MGCLSSKPKDTPTPPQDQPKTLDPQTPSPKPQPPSSEFDISSLYKIEKVLGKGAFSVVKKGIHKETGEVYAIKCINKKTVPEEELKLLEREINIMQKLEHDHIIRLKETHENKSTLYLVLEFVPGGELFDAIVDKGNYSEEETAELVRQMLEAIAYCHSQNIAHRDLKPENLLLKSKEPPFLKIADFGLSKDFGEGQLATACGTPDYVAPEVIDESEDTDKRTYGPAVDIWSIGVITYVLLCGYPPFDEENQSELFKKILAADFDFPEEEWEEVSEEAKDFIRRLLVVDPSKRPTAQDCLDDPWINKAKKAQDKKALKRNKSFAVKKFQEKQEQYKNEKAKKATAQDNDE